MYSLQDHIGLDGRPHYDFISLSKELEPPCTIYDQRRTYPFNFPNVEKIHETYHGKHVSVHYFIRVALERKFLPPLTKEREVIVQKLTLLNNVMAMSASSAPVNNTSKNGGDKKDKNNEKKDNIGGGVVVAAAAGDDNDEPIKMEVGIEDCLHIEFEYKKRHYHLQDVIEGNVNFLLVRIRIKYMELTLLRRETAGSLVGGTISSIGGGGIGGGGFGGTNTIEGGQGSNVTTETQVLLKYEVMDGAPVRGEVIPVKLFLRGVPADLTPTYSAGHNSRFCVRYFINLVLVDEEDRRYFKQSEIILHRTALG